MTRGRAQAREMEAHASLTSDQRGDGQRPRNLVSVESPWHAVDESAYDLDVRHYKVCKVVGVTWFQCFTLMGWCPTVYS